MTDQALSPPVAPENTGGKQDGRFAPGESGNPNGRPRGARNVTTRAVEALLGGEAEGVARAVVAAALGGDVTAMKIVLDRVAPAPRERLVQIDLPSVGEPRDAPQLVLALLSAVASGTISPREADGVARLLEVYRRVVETVDLDARLQALEKARGKAD